MIHVDLSDHVIYIACVSQHFVALRVKRICTVEPPIAIRTLHIYTNLYSSKLIEIPDLLTIIADLRNSVPCICDITTFYQNQLPAIIL